TVAYRTGGFTFSKIRTPTRSTLFPYTTLFRSSRRRARDREGGDGGQGADDREQPLERAARSDRRSAEELLVSGVRLRWRGQNPEDRKSTRLNSSHSQISYAVFCLKKKKKINRYLLIIIPPCPNVSLFLSSKSIFLTKDMNKNRNALLINIFLF